MRIKAFLSGALVAVLIAAACFTTPVGAQQIMRIYGTVGGAPIALLATAGGVLRVSLDGGAIPASTCAAPALGLSGGATTGIAFTATPSVLTCISGTAVFTVSSSVSTTLLMQVPVIQIGGGVLRDNGTSNVLEMRNGTAANIFNVYNTYTSATQGEWGGFDWQTQANVLLVAARTAATGTGRSALFGAQISNGSNTYAALVANRQTQAQWGGTGTTAFLGLGLLAADTTSAVTTGANGAIVSMGFGTRVSNTGTNIGVAILPIYNSGGGGSESNTDLLINRTETSAVGSGTQNLIDGQVGGVSFFSVTRTGTVSGVTNAMNRYVINASSAATTGTVATDQIVNKAVASIADNTATDVFTVTVPNASHAATIRVMYSGSLGAGGAIGAGEATGNISYDIAVARTAGVATVATLSAAYGSSTSAVAGAATITVTGTVSGMTGAVGATQTFTIRVTIARGSGASTNHTARVVAEILNANASGITIS